jgi:glycosyltransferase involved in cell wall biosynthesis
MPESPEVKLHDEVNPWCTVVVPCYNEALRLPTSQFLEFVQRPLPIRLLFVNDGSRDGTLSALESLRSGREDRIQILDKPKNAGKGEAVRDGMLKACKDGGSSYVGFWDADLATPLDAIPLLLEKLRENDRLQMVFGSRVRLLGREVHRKAIRHYLGRVFASAASTMLGLPIYDTQCGAKLFRVTPELSNVLAEPFISRWVFDVEILARYIALHKGDREYLYHSVYEFPLPRWEDISGSKVHGGDFLQAFLDMERIYRRYLR